jgi:hypothetical protein
LILCISTPVMEYRLFFMGSRGHFEGVIEMEAEDDELAILAAEDLADGRAMELWRLAVCVKSFPPGI